MKLKFEYDANKSLSNKEKHGIDFQKSEELWVDEKKVIFLAKKSDSEIRYMVVGMIMEKYYSVIVTFREDKIRIISARRSRKNEIACYERGSNGR